MTSRTPNKLTVFLTEARDRHAATTGDQDDLKLMEIVQLQEASVADVPTLLAIIGAALNRHHRHDCARDGGCLCGEQKEFCACGEEWPCTTRAMMTAAAPDKPDSAQQPLDGIPALNLEGAENRG